MSWHTSLALALASKTILVLDASSAHQCADQPQANTLAVSVETGLVGCNFSAIGAATTVRAEIPTCARARKHVRESVNVCKCLGWS